MELGQKLKQVRLEAGLSQRQLCGERISRNMLSLIENGSAKPSMDTLRYLAQKLGKPISFFLEEQESFPNAVCMRSAREAFERKDYEGCLEHLKTYVGEAEDWEHGLLTCLCCLQLAQKALRQEKRPYADTLLQQADKAISSTPYFPLVQSAYSLLMAQAHPEQAEIFSHQLPDLTPSLLLRSCAALQQKDYDQSLMYLQAADDRSAQWHFFMAETLFGQGNYLDAAEHYQNALAVDRRRCYAQLETCYRNLGDFENAYFCACKLREL